MSHCVPTVKKVTAFLPASAPSAISITCGLVEVYVATPGYEPPRTSAHESSSVPAAWVSVEASSQNVASLVTISGTAAMHAAARSEAHELVIIFMSNHLSLECIRRKS